ncbi:MAG: hypothetical protein V3V49_10520 [Candidatus Krumholzibacteria bacterium]
MDKRIARSISLCLALFLAAISVTTANAQGLRPAIGARTGFSVDPDQFTIGIQSQLGSFSIGRFAPSVDFGFGNDLTVTAFNLDVQASLLSFPGSSTSIYGGAGPTLSILSPEGRGSDTEIGFSLVAGLKMPFSPLNYYNVEARFGFGDIPDFKLLVGAMIGLK